MKMRQRAVAGDRYTTAQAAELCGLNPSTVCQRIREACTFSTDGIGRYVIVGRFVNWIMDYEREHGRRPNQPTFGEWLDANHHRRPKLSDVVQRTEVVVREGNVRVRDQQRSDSKDGFGAEIKRMKALIAHLQDEVRELKDAKTGRRDLKVLPGPSGIRERIRRAVNTFVYDRPRVISHKIAWSELYRRFWIATGDGQAPASWYQTQMDGEAKLSWFERQGTIQLLAEALPSILGEMSSDYPTEALQQELEL